MEPRGERATNWVTLALGAGASIGLSGWGALRAYRATVAEVSLFTRRPPLGFWAAALVICLTTATLGIWAMTRGWSVRLTRLSAVAFAVLAFAQLFVLPSEDPLGGSVGQLLIAESFASELSDRSTEASVVTSEKELGELIAALPAPPLLERGHELEQWRLRVFGACSGPLTHVEAPAATLIYCVAPDLKSAWVEVVGLQSSTYGGPELISFQGRPFAREVRARPKPAPHEPPD